MIELDSKDKLWLQRVHMDALAAERTREHFIRYLFYKYEVKQDEFVVDIDHGVLKEKE